MSLEGSASLPASSIFLQAEVGRGELEGAGLRYTSKFSSSPNKSDGKGGKEEKPGRVADSEAVGRLSHLESCWLLPELAPSGTSGTEQRPSPHLLWSAAAVRRSWRGAPPHPHPRLQAAGQAASAPAFLWRINQGPAPPAAVHPSFSLHPSSLRDFSISSSGGDLLL